MSGLGKYVNELSGGSLGTVCAFLKDRPTNALTEQEKRALSLYTEGLNLSSKGDHIRGTERYEKAQELLEKAGYNIT